MTSTRADAGAMEPEPSDRDTPPKRVRDAPPSADATPQGETGESKPPPAPADTPTDDAGSPDVTPPPEAEDDAGDIAMPPIDAGPGPDAGTEPSTNTELCSTCGRCEEVFPLTSAVHTTDPVDYPNTPPTNGSHNPCWATWGVHATPVLDDRWVHNLEHGGVVLLYNCPDGCDADVTKLEQFVSAHRRMLLTPYDAMPTRFAIVAWNHRLLTDCVDDAAFSAFYDANFDHGSESEDGEPDDACPP